MSKTVLLVPVLVLLALPAVAQTPAAPVAPTAPAVVPFENDLIRVAEILGALHHLRPLCGANETSLWRDEMSALVLAEGQIGQKRDRLIGAFNGGYSAYERAYSSCTPAAMTAQRRFMEEGAKLARDIHSRFGSD